MEIKDISLEAQTAVVTGGGSGIGKAIALEFARAGANVALAGRRLSLLQETAREIKALGRSALCVSTDVSQKESVDNLVQNVINEFGTIDILVNAAGVVGSGEKKSLLVKISEEAWDKVIDIDLKGCFLCAAAASQVMIEHKRGNIINISSIAGFITWDTGGVYNIAKAGVNMLTRLLARQLARYNIRVNAINPGMIKTPMTEPVWSNAEMTQRWNDFIPLGHLGEPGDISRVALFLASDTGRHITGHMLVVDGGQILQDKYGL